ncbi:MULTISPECIES: hypothetical protein [unclassified Moraxella]|uniref:hypothetical protein n=1 Tax=unclassified Moraxella TaxID=2685852 RepID=UPI002B40B464|nr:MULTISPECIES: hypothetical protein [unclassified Moraxella]
MGLIGYLVLGSVMYLAGFMVRQKFLKPYQKQAKDGRLPILHPALMKCLIICFGVMLVVSALMGRFILHHLVFDWAFVLMNSLVATVVFYFGVNPDITRMNLPD